MEKIKKTLEKLGLNENEIEIYITSLSVWQSPASILWKKNNIARSTAQYTCQALVEKWLLSVVLKWNTFLYSPEDPDKLLTMVNKEYELVEKKFISTKTILWDLKSLMNPDMKMPSVKYFSWLEGLIDLIEDVFIQQPNFMYWAMEVGEDMHPGVVKYLEEQYMPKRKKMKIDSKFLMNDDEGSRKYGSPEKWLWRNIVHVSTDSYPFDGCMMIYWDKVAFFSYKQTDMTGILIENKYIQQMMLSVFKLAWNAAIKLPGNIQEKREEL